MMTPKGMWPWSFYWKCLLWRHLISRRITDCLFKSGGFCVFFHSSGPFLLEESEDSKIPWWSVESNDFKVSFGVRRFHSIWRASLNCDRFQFKKALANLQDTSKATVCMVHKNQYKRNTLILLSIFPFFFGVPGQNETQTKISIGDPWF